MENSWDCFLLCSFVSMNPAELTEKTKNTKGGSFLDSKNRSLIDRLLAFHDCHKLVDIKYILCKNDGYNSRQAILAAEGRFYKAKYERKNRIRKQWGNSINNLQLLVPS